LPIAAALAENGYATADGRPYSAMGVSNMLAN
jgi:hypothetical protein